MNIMLVSVTERTREIGIRKSIGAKTAAIMSQFLFEASILTFLGGIVGIILGIILAHIICTAIGFSVIITPSSVLGAAFFSILVGLFFGLYPARKAAKMKLPISGFKKSNNKKQNNNQQQQQEVMEQSQPIEMTSEQPSNVAQEENQKRDNKKGKKQNKRSLNKQQLNEDANVKTAETMITKEDEIQPVIVEQPVVSENTEAAADVQSEETPKKTRRPNRGGGTKTKRQPRKRKSEESVAE